MCIRDSAHAQYIYVLAWSRDGELLASVAPFDDYACLWDGLSGELLARLPRTPSGYGVAFDATGDRLVVLELHSGVPHLRMWDLGTGLEQAVTRVGNDKPTWMQKYLGWMPDEFGKDALSLAAGSFVVGDKDDPAHLYSLEGTRLVHHRLLGDEKGSGYGVSFSADGTLLATTSTTGDVLIWDTATWSLTARLKGHLGRAYCAAFHPDGTRLATGGNDNRILIWDTGSWELLLELLGHDQYVHDLDWSPDGTRLASASGDATVRIWDSVPARERYRQVAERRERRAALRALLARSAPAPPAEAGDGAGPR